MGNATAVLPMTTGVSAGASLLSTLVELDTERRASGAANGQSEARAEAIGGRLQANVELSAPRSFCSHLRSKSS